MTTRIISLLACAAVIPAATAQSSLYEYFGSQTGDLFGAQSEPVGDLNSDGFNDFVLAALAGPGQIYAHSGRDGALLYSRAGSWSGAAFGTQIAALGDVNADAVHDYIGLAVELGQVADLERVVHVVSGVDGSTLYSFDYDWHTSADSAAVLGDLNQDSIPDFIIGMESTAIDPLAASTGPYEIRSGVDGSLIRARTGTQLNDDMGASVLGLQDVNGDGLDDYAVTSRGRHVLAMNSGVVEVFSGMDDSLIYARSGPMANDLMGWSIATMGDLNSDGIDELVVGLNRNPGMVQLLSGADGTVLLEVLGTPQGAGFGWTVAGAGDFNNDEHARLRSRRLRSQLVHRADHDSKRRRRLRPCIRRR